MNRSAKCCLSVQAVYALGEGYTTWKTMLTQQSTWHRWGLWI